MATKKMTATVSDLHLVVTNTNSKGVTTGKLVQYVVEDDRLVADTDRGVFR